MGRVSCVRGARAVRRSAAGLQAAEPRRQPRVLALIADPPGINPGQPVTLSLLVAHADEVSVSWRACGAFDSFVGGGSQYGEEDDDGCGQGNAVELGTQPTAVLPGALTQNLFDNLELAAVILGAQLPPDTVRNIREQVGLPFLIEAHVSPTASRSACSSAY